MITPEQLAAPGTEHAHQVAFFQWLVTSGIEDRHMAFAVPNGGERQQVVASKMKAEGVKSGVPDVCWPVPRGRFAGLWLELKRPGAERRKNWDRSDAQIKWHKDLIKHHYAVCLVCGWEAMAWAIHLYANLHEQFAFEWCNYNMGPNGKEDAFLVVGTNVEGFRYA